MAIELRNGKAYRYHKVWRGGRSVSIYAGAITTAEREADELERAERLARRARAQMLVQGIDAALAVVRAHSESAEAVLKAASVAGRARRLIGTPPAAKRSHLRVWVRFRVARATFSRRNEPIWGSG